MSEVYGLFMTLLLGLFIVLGSVIVIVFKNTDKMINFSISCAFGVMLSLGLFELLPEALEHLGEGTKNVYLFFIIFVIVGMGILTVLDRFIPDHDILEENEKEINENLHHIGLVSSIALILHNIIEGMAIYSTLTTDPKLGLFMAIGVGLHNIPLGMVIASTFYKYNNSIKKTLLMSTVISLSTLAGGILMHLLNSFITPFLLGVLLSITLGMIVYIVIFELLPHLLSHRKEKNTWIGAIVGILVLFISKLF